MKASEMEKGQAVRIDGKLYTIVDYEHVKIGKGGAVYQTKLKTIADGSIQNARIRSEDTIEDIELDKSPYEYLYNQGGEYVLMNTVNFEQISLKGDAFGDGLKYLKPNIQLLVSTYEGKVVTITLPNTVDFKVTETPPEIKGATVTSKNKPATLDNGSIISVPVFIKVGDIVRVDTRSGEYVTRVKE